MTEIKVDRTSTEEKSPGQAYNDNNDKPSAKSNAKDPSRPRRKKARRACFACQRAHLTCGMYSTQPARLYYYGDVLPDVQQLTYKKGDERPCLRCIKRGLQDQCHDGVRKKAKYLHDAPAEALMPGFAGNYNLNGSHTIPNVPSAGHVGPHGIPVSQPSNFYPQNTPSSYPQYSPVAQQGRMHPPLMDTPNMVGDYSGQPTVDTPAQFQSNSSQQVSPDMPNTLDQNFQLGSAGNNSFDKSFFDPNDPSMFNFNISDMNFGNHYGALEFGMLGHMTSRAGNTPDMDMMTSMGQSNQGSVSYDATPAFATNFGYNQPLQPWQNARQSSTTDLWALNNSGMDAFAVGEHTGSLTGTSPQSSGQDFGGGYSSSTVSPEMQFAQPDQHHEPDLLRQSFSQAQQHLRKPLPFPDDVNQGETKKRRRDTSLIYASVQAPYAYTSRFHSFTEFLQRRYPSGKVVKIAKALASIRPSFISCNKDLNDDDLIFMEKCFQRTLHQYEGYLNYYGTPTVIFRRTGEITGVSKEFSLVTGWRRDVLLGKEPNLNVNTGYNGSGSQTGSSSKGTVTPRMPNTGTDPPGPQPVFLAELLDENSIVEFYEDFAELAFGASRSSIIGARVSLLKYKTKDDPGWTPEDRYTQDGKRVKKQGDVKAESLMKGAEGMNALGEKDGRVEAVMCWTVKRDVFDIPMLFVMNVSIHPHHPYTLKRPLTILPVPSSNLAALTTSLGGYKISSSTEWSLA